MFSLSLSTGERYEVYGLTHLHKPYEKTLFVTLAAMLFTQFAHLLLSHPLFTFTVHTKPVRLHNS